MDATFVLKVHKKQSARIRGQLTPELLGAATCRERKTFSASEFFLSGPAADARRAHAALRDLLREQERIRF